MLRLIQDLAIGMYALVLRSGVLESTLGERLFIALYLWYKRRLEAWQVEHLRKFVSPNSTVIDVGANIGFVTTQVADWVGSSGRVIAIEPEAINCRRLRSILRGRPDIAGKVVLFEGAAAEYDGEVSLKVNKFHPGDHRIGEATELGVSIPCAKLDTLFGLHGTGKVSLLKIDVQGAELRVLQGASQMLAQFKPAVFLEVEDDMLRSQGASADLLFDHLKELNYQPYVITKSGPHTVDWSEARMKVAEHGYFDFLFL